jgi:glutamate synthase domain-containing protein 2/glutamate synthase domain-containing protein 1/glutamate synthase domain-containing protein 3
MSAGPLPGSNAPARQGLYDPSQEHESCGVGFVAHVKGERSHGIVERGIDVLRKLAHRGACGCDPETGDGAGITIQVPDAFLRACCAEQRIELPPPGEYGVGIVFLPRDVTVRNTCLRLFEKGIRREQQRVLGWRNVPVDPGACGPLARGTMPEIRMIFIGAGRGVRDRATLERKLYVIRRSVERAVREADIPNPASFYVASLSTRTLVYKGLLRPEQFERFYADLRDQSVVSALALVHGRFSTNTFPSWERAHPYRYIAHNGEINTLRGNVNWMRARENSFASPLFGDDIGKLLPIIDHHGSDSAMFDNMLELLLATGRSLPHAIMMMMPEAWENDAAMDSGKRAFYQYHACLMEGWDGPAAIAFTDGERIGAVLDRNGLRPARYVRTCDDLIVMASEVGVLDVPPECVVEKGRLEPGRMLLVDVQAGRLVPDEEAKAKVCRRKPYRQWLTEKSVRLSSLPPPDAAVPRYDPDTVLTRQRAFGYTEEDMRLLLAPMAQNGQEPVGSMGTDTPLAVLSDRPRLVFDYFRQLFAQVTNPPIDPLREELVMSVRSSVGPERNLFDETPGHCHQLELPSPILGNPELQQIKEIEVGRLRTRTLSTLFKSRSGAAGLRRALRELCEGAARAIHDGATILVLSDRGVDAAHVPVPSLLATSALHHFLIRKGIRTRCGLIVETAEAREVMHFALLVGYGAGAVNPYLATETIEHLVETEHLPGLTVEKAVGNFVKAINKALLKVMSKMGISTLQSYQGAQIFEAVGLAQGLVDRYFTGTPSRLEGIGLAEIAAEAQQRHDAAFDVPHPEEPGLDIGGEYQWRRGGERHRWGPETVAALQHAVQLGDLARYREFARLADDEARRHMTLRGLLRLKPGVPVPLDEVEPVESIVRRFKTGGMSLGAISREAHETLAIAMNRLGGRSNTGEGGEDPARYHDERRSAIKQVASGRFGVTIGYLVNADELQIKMAQGSKPGEGGQLPGHKVDAYIARLRHATPGVGLISPPPHHDIYSIEDLAQLIYDLKCANGRARISVKLVAEMGVGTIAAGVAKTKADVVLISGDSGGTGASPLSSIKHAGVPWELGLAEAQQVLVMNDLRGRVRLEVDGQLMTGRDVVVAALLGAEEFGFATAALVAEGCVMMRVCHLNTCPVGVATQDEALRKRFTGRPEHVENYMRFVAAEVRERMAELGFRTLDAMVGRVDLLDARGAVDHYKAQGIDLSPILYRPDMPADVATRCVTAQDHGLDGTLDRQILAAIAPAIEERRPVRIERAVRNIDRAVGTMLSSAVARRWGDEGLPPGTIELRLTGSAGQSFCAFLAPGFDVTLEGDANDYFCKGLSGGRVVAYPPPGSPFAAEDNVIVGNVALYGATGGEVFLRGRAGERFAVRNSGATAVVEGVGNHGCEYMTRGVVVVLGRTGRNFAAGMSGGVAYVLDERRDFDARCNLTLVELEDLDEDDAACVRALVQRHYDLTKSQVAWRVLSGWRDAVRHFVKVMPVEYRKVVAREGLDPAALRLASV